MKTLDIPFLQDAQSRQCIRLRHPCLHYHLSAVGSGVRRGGGRGAGTVVSATIIEGEYCIKKFDCEYYVLVLEFNYGKADANKQGVGPGYQQPSTNSLRAIGYWALQLCL